MRKKSFIIIGLGIFILWGCEQLPWSVGKPKKSASGPPKGATVVATVGDFYITTDDLKREIDNYNSLMDAQRMPQNKIETREKKITYLKEDVVRKYILYQEALKRGLDKKEDIRKVLEDARISLLVAALLREETEKIEVSDKEIEDFYNQNKNLLKEPDQRKISEIVTETEEQAKQVYIELLKGGDFATLARQYSKAISVGNGGDLGYITYEFDPKKRIRFDQFYEVAFSPSLDVGGISNIFKGPDGYYIIKLQDIKISEVKPFKDLKGNIKNWLLFEKQQKALANLSDKLSQDTKIEIHEGNIN
jgi:peptidyl-prolyl cis-trans isomerase C